MITVYEKEVEISFNTEFKSGYLNFEVNDEGVTMTFSSGEINDVYEDIIKTFSHEDMYTVLEETLRILKSKVE